MTNAPVVTESCASVQTKLIRSFAWLFEPNTGGYLNQIQGSGVFKEGGGCFVSKLYKAQQLLVK